MAHPILSPANIALNNARSSDSLISPSIDSVEGNPITHVDYRGERIRETGKITGTKDVYRDPPTVITFVIAEIDGSEQEYHPVWLLECTECGTIHHVCDFPFRCICGHPHGDVDDRPSLGDVMHDDDHVQASLANSSAWGDD